MPVRGGLRRRFVTVLGVFVLGGSLAVLGVFLSERRRESRERFTAIALTNAAFLDRTPLPRSAQMAAQLSEILKLQVVFRIRGTLTGPPGKSWPADLGTLPAAAADAVPAVLTDGREALVVPLADGGEVCFVRDAEPLAAGLTHPRMLGALLLFWLLALGLGGALARHLIRPLRALTERLPDLESATAAVDVPAVERPDEIGDLARALQGSQERLIAERRRREDAERLALLGRMATGLAHEVKNPVAAIRLHAQLLESAEPADPEQTAGLGHILSEAAKIEGLVNQWCFLARPEPPVTSPADAGEVARAVCQSAGAAARHAGVALTFHPGPPLAVKVDRQRISQALANVVQNALQACAPGGTVEVRPGRADGHAVIRVTDTGSGFSPEALVHFADPFFSRKEGGMGLGLSVASGAAAAHGGALRAANSPQGGAVVTLTLPLHPES